MDITPYVESVKNGVTEASALADDQTRDVAHRLGGAIDSATRLALIRALTDAAAIVSADLAPSSVEVRMAGPDPELVVRVPASDTSPTLILPPPQTPAAPEPESDTDPGSGDEATARISLRLPASVKTKVDEVADREGISTNAWLQRAILDALGEPRGVRSAAESVRGLLNSVGPFGPDGPFGPHGVFGPHGPFGDPDRRHAVSPSAGMNRQHTQGPVRGWVR